MQPELFASLDKLASYYGPGWSGKEVGDAVEKLLEELQAKSEDLTLTKQVREWIQADADALAEIGIVMDSVKDFGTWTLFSSEWSKYKNFWRPL